MSFGGRWFKIEGVITIETEWCGRVDYLTAWAWQKSFVEARTTDPNLPGRLLLLEHPPTFTLGTRGKMANLLASKDRLAAEGIAVHQVDRGGDITYHGPGQLVAYPILNLKKMSRQKGIDLHGYVRSLEEVIIEALRPFGIAGRRLPGFTGVWVKHGPELLKVAAIGVRVNTKGISSHGFALNVAPNMDHFNLIIPCGIQNHGVVALSELLEGPITVEALLEPIVAAFARVFQVDMPLPLPPKES